MSNGMSRNSKDLLLGPNSPIMQVIRQPQIMHVKYSGRSTFFKQKQRNERIQEEWKKANPQRVTANRFASQKVMKYFTRGIVNSNVEKILKCNELFCNRSVADNFKEGSGAGFLKCLEVIVDVAAKDKNKEILHILIICVLLIIIGKLEKK